MAFCFYSYLNKKNKRITPLSLHMHSLFNNGLLLNKSIKMQVHTIRFHVSARSQKLRKFKKLPGLAWKIKISPDYEKSSLIFSEFPWLSSTCPPLNFPWLYETCKCLLKIWVHEEFCNRAPF